MPLASQHDYKCMRPKLPRAKTIVFHQYESNLERGERVLKFEGQFYLDDKRPQHETGYTSDYKGDSGAPFMRSKTVFNENGKHHELGVHKKYTFVAVVSHILKTWDNEAAGSYLMHIENQCRSVATKITENILAWIKQMAQIPPRT